MNFSVFIEGNNLFIYCYCGDFTAAMQANELECSTMESDENLFCKTATTLSIILFLGAYEIVQATLTGIYKFKDKSKSNLKR